MGGIHAIISTHTTRHLRTTIHGVARQTVPPASIVVTCDTDDPSIRTLVQACAGDFGVPILLVQRAHTGDSRSSQVRNNGVRALKAHAPAAGGRLWFLDGDCLPAPDALAQHARLSGAGSGKVVVGFRIDLTPEQTERLSPQAIEERRVPVEVTPEQQKALTERHRRYQRAALMKRLGAGKSHKPKLLSANFCVSLRDYENINGFDEEYIGYGQEDDDLGRRLYAAGVRPVIGVGDAVVFHQYHATRAPRAWHEAPNVARFERTYEIRAPRGLNSPLEQGPVRVEWIGRAS